MESRDPYGFSGLRGSYGAGSGERPEFVALRRIARFVEGPCRVVRLRTGAHGNVRYINLYS